MLHPSQLEINYYLFTKIIAELDYESAPEDGAVEIKRENLEFDFNVVKDLDDGREIVLTLSVWSDDENQPTGLKLGFDVVGKFTAAEELVERVSSGRSRQEDVIATCLSILYGTIRDAVLYCTAKMPIGPIYLPTCTFPLLRTDEERS